MDTPFHSEWTKKIAADPQKESTANINIKNAFLIREHLLLSMQH